MQLLRWIGMLRRQEANPPQKTPGLSPVSSLTQLVSEPFGVVVQEGKEHRTAGLMLLEAVWLQSLIKLCCQSRDGGGSRLGADRRSCRDKEEEIEAALGGERPRAGQDSQVLNLVICETLLISKRKV